MPRRKKTEVEKPKTATRKRIAKVIDMDAKLKEITPTTGRTRFQQYMREKIKNADIEKA